MHRAGVGVVAFGGLVTALVACVGGPGALPDQGIDQASQGGGVTGDPSGSAGSSSTTGNAGSGSGTAPPNKTEPALPTTIFVAGYNRNCNDNTDCVLVFQGAVCTACQCPNGAVAESDEAKYQSDLLARSANCPDQGDVACSPCPTTAARCDPATSRCIQGTAQDGG